MWNVILYKIELYIGLPGSGKTYMANLLSNIIVDDITDIAQLPSPDELGDLSLGITDVNFCDSKILSRATQILEKRYEVSSIKNYYFENCPDKCRANVITRNDGRNVEGTIVRFTPIYSPPENAIFIWDSRK